MGDDAKPMRLYIVTEHDGGGLLSLWPSLGSAYQEAVRLQGMRPHQGIRLDYEIAEVAVGDPDGARLGRMWLDNPLYDPPPVAEGETQDFSHLGPPVELLDRPPGADG